MTNLTKTAALGGSIVAMIFSAALGCQQDISESPEESSASVTASCSSPSAAGVIANGDDGNVPSNTVDGNLNTRWSQKGVGSWIQFDLGTAKTISSVKLAWFRGDERSAKVRVEVSSNGTAFTSVFSGTSSGDTNELESYAFNAATTARFVRIVVDGNTDNTWASITEVQTCAAPATTPDAGTSTDGGAATTDAGANPNADGGGVVSPPGAYPIPVGFTKVGDFNTAFEHWGRHTTNYASGGSGPSERWDNEEMDKLNMVAGYEFKIGPAHGQRGDDEVTLKFPRCRTNAGNRGNYIPFIGWSVNGSNSIGGVGKEYPHPTTSHLDFNVDDPRPTIGNIKDGQWHGLLAAVYNDAAGIPTIVLWYNKTASGLVQDYVLLGRSKDSGSGQTQITPGPVLSFSGAGGNGGHDMQVRIDEIPQSAIEVRKMFAVEVVPPSN